MACTYEYKWLKSRRCNYFRFLLYVICLCSYKSTVLYILRIDSDSTRERALYHLHVKSSIATHLPDAILNILVVFQDIYNHTTPWTTGSGSVGNQSDTIPTDLLVLIIGVDSHFLTPIAADNSYRLAPSIICCSANRILYLFVWILCWWKKYVSIDNITYRSWEQL